jgi:hypothetical protein
MLLRVVAGVRDQVVKRAAGGKITLEIIEAVFTGLTIVDHIVYVAYDTPVDNPIWGEFCRWSKRPGVYTPMETIVEVRYAAHLRTDWRRLVVCKELCHSLESSEGCHDASSTAMDNLVDSFSLQSHAKNGNTGFPPFEAEILAQVGAIELLCPIEMRKQLLSGPAPIDAITLSQNFEIPIEIAQKIVDPGYNDAIEWLLANH